MAAGDSALAEAKRQLAIAEAHEQAAAQARRTAGRYAVASTTEFSTAKTLALLSPLGHHLLNDRAWPGSRRAQVDLVVVGPGGVFIVDTKAWKDVRVERDRIFRGDLDVTDDVLSIADLAEATAAELAEVGLAPGEVHGLIVLAGRRGVDLLLGPLRVLGEQDVGRHIAAKGARLSQARVDAVLTRCLAWFPVVGSPAPASAVIVEPPSAGPAPSEDDHQPALVSEDEVREVTLASIMAEPIEDWMAFLDPGQAKLASRSFSGPSRIRGAAGTGKTVVALHRAAWLARTRPGRVLVTTYVKTLPNVLRASLSRMAPPSVTDRVDFMGVHAFAARLLNQRGVSFTLNTGDDAWREAWATVGRPGLLAASRQNERYWRDEVEHVIKGRSLVRFEDYAELARTGRRHAISEQQRRAVWELFCSYQAALARRCQVDFADVITLADRELERDPATPYVAVVADEAQDLSCTMVRLLSRIVGDLPDGLTLVGDGQQSIYPGGYTLREAGVSVVGRATVLGRNYRNTAQILDFARRVVADDEYPDIEGQLMREHGPDEVVRSGVEPTLMQFLDASRLEREVVDRVRGQLADVETHPGDIGVLCRTLGEVKAITVALRRAGVSVVMLDQYDGVRSHEVKVGTIKRAKGLEFKHVLVPTRRSDLLDDAPAEAEVLEDWARVRRELYVAMTRARDTLWVGVID